MMEDERSESSSLESEPEEEKDDVSSNASGEEDSDVDEEDMAEQTALRSQVKDLSFEELEALKQKMGLKEFNEAMFGTGSRKQVQQKPAGLVNKKGKSIAKDSKNKGAPMEVSSKRRVPKLRQVVEVPKTSRRDPRFDKSCGEFSDQIWNSEYKFIRDIQKDEAEKLKQDVKSEGDKKKQREMRKFIQRVADKEKAIAAKERAAERNKQDKEENRKRIAEGKKPYYVKESTKKLLELAEKYDELKSTGRLEKYLKKKRKRNAVRDRKTLK